MAKGKQASTATRSARGGKPSAIPRGGKSTTSSSRPAAATASAVARSPSPQASAGREEDLSTAIAFETRQDWEVVRGKLERQVREIAKEVCDVEGVADGPVRSEVERVMVEDFLVRTLNLMRHNITIDGHRPPPSLLSPSSPTSSSATKTEPYSEKLNDRVMRKQQILLDASVGNARKRRVLPGHVVEMLSKAVKKEEESCSRIVDPETGDELARWKAGDVRLINRSIPDAAAAEAEYAKASDTFDEMLKYVPDEGARAQRAAEVQLEVAKQVSVTS